MIAFSGISLLIYVQYRQFTNFARDVTTYDFTSITCSKMRLSSPFVQPGNSPPFAGSRFTINGIEATDEAALDHIRVYLMEHSRGRECGILGNIWAFQTWCMSGAQSEGRLLSSFESRLRASPGGGVLLEQLDFLC